MITSSFNQNHNRPALIKNLMLKRLKKRFDNVAIPVLSLVQQKKCLKSSRLIYQVHLTKISSPLENSRLWPISARTNQALRQINFEERFFLFSNSGGSEIQSIEYRIQPSSGKLVSIPFKFRIWPSGITWHLSLYLRICLSLNAIVYLFSPVGGSRVHGGEVWDQVIFGETRCHPRGVEVSAGEQDC